MYAAVPPGIGQLLQTSRFILSDAFGARPYVSDLDQSWMIGGKARRTAESMLSSTHILMDLSPALVMICAPVVDKVCAKPLLRPLSTRGGCYLRATIETGTVKYMPACPSGREGCWCFGVSGTGELPGALSIPHRLDILRFSGNSLEEKGHGTLVAR